MKAKIDKVSNFLTPNFTLEENKHEIDVQKAYIWTSRTSNAQLSYAILGFNACGHSSQIVPYYLKLYFTVGVFLYVSPIFQKYIFLGHLGTMTSKCTIEKDSIATTPHYFKDCILACKISNQVHTNFEKKTFHKQPVVILFKNDCYVRHMSCTMFVSLSVTKILEKHIRSSSTYYRSFSIKIRIHRENLLNGYFCYSSFI